MRIRNKLTIKGTVQGVFFRNFVKEEADKIGLKGFVRNLEDGNIEVIVDGDDNDINAFIDKIKAGPKHSIIKDVVVEEKKWGGDLKDFKILRF